MSFSPTLIADLIVNLVAFFAIMLATPAIRSQSATASATERRLRSLFRAIAVLLAFRIAAWFQLSVVFDILVLVVAAWLPLLTLWLAEHVLRRHAYPSLKWFALSGAIGFSVFALATGGIWPWLAGSALALFQMAMLIATVAYLMRRRTDGLAAAETAAVDSLAMALVLAIPFALGDFRSLWPDLPIRIGAVGILLFALAIARIAARTASPRSILLDYAGIFGTSAILAGLIAMVTGMDSVATLIRTFVIIAGVITAMLLLQRQKEASSRAVSGASLLPRLAQLPSVPDLEQILAAHPLLSSGVVLEAVAFTLYDAAAIEQIGIHRVLDAQTILPPMAMGARDDILAKYSASHLIRLGQEPMRFLAVACGPFRTHDVLNAELDMVSRLAEGNMR